MVISILMIANFCIATSCGQDAELHELVTVNKLGMASLNTQFPVSLYSLSQRD